MIQVNNGDRNHYFERTAIQNLFRRCNDMEKIERQSFEYGIIGRSYKNGVIKVFTYYKIQNEKQNNEPSYKSVFNKEILEVIKNHTAVACTNASKNDTI